MAKIPPLKKIKHYIYFLFIFKDFIYLFLKRGEGKEE